MAAPLPLRPDVDADMLRREAAKIGGVTLQIVRDWDEARPEKRPVGVFQCRTDVAPGSASTPRGLRG